MKNKKIIIVDDSNFIVKQLMAFYKKEMGYDIVAVGNSGSEAIDLYREHKPDLMSLDIVMKEMNGLDALTEIMTEFPDAKVLMVSAVRTNELLDCISAGAKGYIGKPIQLGNSEYIQNFKDVLNDVFEE